jgi:hypothetical protein
MRLSTQGQLVMGVTNTAWAGFTTADAGIVIVNPLRVAYLSYGENGGGTRIHFAPDWSVDVKPNIIGVADMLFQPAEQPAPLLRRAWQRIFAPAKPIAESVTS